MATGLEVVLGLRQSQRQVEQDKCVNSIEFRVNVLVTRDKETFVKTPNKHIVANSLSYRVQRCWLQSGVLSTIVR